MHYDASASLPPKRRMATIILADDEEIIRTLAKRVLTKAGHRVHEARDGHEAVALFPAVAPDLVITDMIMPGKDGGEAIAELLSKDPEVRIIAMSGGGRGNLSSILALASELGARKTLPKPFTVSEFMRVVNEALDEKPKVAQRN